MFVIKSNIKKKISSNNKSKYKIDYSVSGEAFLSKPNNTTFMIRDIIKKITKIKPKLQQLVELLMRDLLEK